MYQSSRLCPCMDRIKRFSMNIMSLLQPLVISASAIAFATSAHAIPPRPVDGKYSTYNSVESNLPIELVIKRGKVVYARWRPVAGCNLSDPQDSRSCIKIQSQLKALDKCTLIWSILWEENYYKRVTLRRDSCSS